MTHKPSIDAARDRLSRADEFCEAARVLMVQCHYAGATLMMREAASQLFLAPACLQILRMPEAGLLGRPLQERAAVVAHAGAIPPLSAGARAAIDLLETGALRLQAPGPLDIVEEWGSGAMRRLEDAYATLRAEVVAAMPAEVTAEPDDIPSPSL